MLWLIALTGLLATEPARAQTPPSRGEIIYHLAGFVQWPEQARVPGSFVVCIAGSDPATVQIQEGMQNRLMFGRPVVIHTVSSTAGMRTCQMLFLGRSMRGQVKQILQALEGIPVITVSAIPGFGQMGGMVELTLPPLRRPFALNAEAARRSGFTFQASLFSVAYIARTEDSTE